MSHNKLYYVVAEAFDDALPFHIGIEVTAKSKKDALRIARNCMQDKSYTVLSFEEW
jgi:hypothetical protein